MSNVISAKKCKRLGAFTKFEQSLFLVLFWQRELTLYSPNDEDAGSRQLSAIDPDVTIELLRSGMYGARPDGLVHKDENFVHDAFGVLSRLSVDQYDVPFRTMISGWFVARDDIATRKCQCQPLEMIVGSWVANSSTGWMARELIADMLDRQTGLPREIFVTPAGHVAGEDDLDWVDGALANEETVLHIDLSLLAEFLGTGRGLAWARTRSLNLSPEFLQPFAIEKGKEANATPRQSEKKPKSARGRRPGSGAIDDSIVIEKMRAWLNEDPNRAPWAAANEFAAEAGGSATQENKAKRIFEKYRAAYSSA